MSLNLYNLIIKTAEERGQDVDLYEIGKINDDINQLVKRGINPNWITNNLEVLL